jgi:C1A family cysteine protease
LKDLNANKRPPAGTATPRYPLGWIPDIPDRRDHLYAAPVVTLRHLPQAVDLRGQFPRVPFDQGQVGSCTANAIAGAIEFDRVKEKFRPDFVPSRLFIYYNERVREHSVNSDAGAMLRDGIKTVHKQGFCPEEVWPYDGRLPADQGGPNTRVFESPPAAVYQTASGYRATSYLRIVQNLGQMKGCLAAGYPFVLGFTCYDSLMSDQTARTGDIPLPADDESVIGGHAVLAVGYDESRRVFLIRNSWGTGWGDGGYGTIPYAYLVDGQLSQDFWTIRTTSA